MLLLVSFFFFFFNDTATTEIYTLSLHDALPISAKALGIPSLIHVAGGEVVALPEIGDRKSTRLNSSHSQISYAVFCLKKKKNNKNYHRHNTQHNNRYTQSALCMRATTVLVVTLY